MSSKRGVTGHHINGAHPGDVMYSLHNSICKRKLLCTKMTVNSILKRLWYWEPQLPESNIQKSKNSAPELRHFNPIIIMMLPLIFILTGTFTLTSPISEPYNQIKTSRSKRSIKMPLCCANLYWQDVNLYTCIGQNFNQMYHQHHTSYTG